MTLINTGVIFCADLKYLEVEPLPGQNLSKHYTLQCLALNYILGKLDIIDISF